MDWESKLPERWGGYSPEAIVIHIMDGSLSGTDSWFLNPSSKVSSHYGIGRNGEIHQYVQEENTAYHAGRVHAPSWKNIRTTGPNLYLNPNLYTIGIEHEGNSLSDWTTDMCVSSSALIRDIALRYGILIDRDHIIGHHEIFSLKTCPGEKVDITKLIADATSPDGTTQGSSIRQEGVVIANKDLNIRLGLPKTQAPIVGTVPVGTKLNYYDIDLNGESVEGNSKWYKDPNGNYFWSGGVSPSTNLGE